MREETATKGTGTRRTQAQRTALSDQLMLEAAIKLINERGTQKTTLKEIGELAGYSRGLANYRFGSKDGLLQELFSRFDDRWKNHLETLSLIHISEPTRLGMLSRMPSSA